MQQSTYFGDSIAGDGFDVDPGGFEQEYEVHHTSGPKVAQVIGGAGTGKTTHLLQLMEKVIERGTDPKKIGFVTFTKAARREAAERAANKFGVTVEDLEVDGYFRTLHSTCYMLLKVSAKEMLTDNKESCEWIANALGEKVTEVSLDGAEPFKGRTKNEIVLGLWHCARNRLEPFEKTWERAMYSDENTPELSYCRKVIESYEQHKRLDGRSDFTDLLGRYAGWKFYFDGPERKQPEGEIPKVDAWFLDECQDNSALSDAVARRIVERSKWVYLVGDPFQAIYGWAGADSKHFMSWPIQDGKQMILQQTYRCPAPVIGLAEQILRNCSDYWDRGIAPAEHKGEVDLYASYKSPWVAELRPDQSWLLIARTNFQASRIGKRLDEAGIPWLPSGSKANNKWNAPVRHNTILALRALQKGQPVSGDEWKLILKSIKSTKEKAYFTRGIKKEWEEKNTEGMFTNLEQIKPWGATDDFVHLIKTGAWINRIDGARTFLDAASRFGYDAIREPKIKVGTVHSVKGAEADNVLLLTSTSHQIKRGQEHTDGFNEERRVEYVAVTRARKRLLVCSEVKQRKNRQAMLCEVM